MRKTSLNLDDQIFEAAKKEAARSKKTLSEVISFWARIGRNHLKNVKAKESRFRPVDLGGDSLIDLTRRNDWMDSLDHDRS